jgi:hypothetical protein
MYLVFGIAQLPPFHRTVCGIEKAKNTARLILPVSSNGLCFEKIISLYFGASKITIIDICRGAKKMGFFGLAQKPSKKLLKFTLIVPSFEKNII